MNPNEALTKAKEALQKAIDQKKMNQEFMNSLGPAVVDALKPVLTEISSNSKLSKDELLSAISNIKINVPKPDTAQVDVKIPEINVPQPIVNVTVPEIQMPEFKEIKLPTINVPKPEVTVNFDASKIKIPDVKVDMPTIMQVMGEVSLADIDKKNPLPVMMVDSKGNLMQFGMGGIGGGKADFFTIKGFEQSAYSELMNADGRLRVSVETGGSGLTDSELRATAVPISQVSGHSWSVNASVSTSPSDQTTDSIATRQVSGFTDSVNVVDAFGSTAVGSVFNADNRIRVSVETGGSGLTDSELRASSVPVTQASGGIWSVYAQDALTTITATSLVNADNRLRVSLETGGSGLTDSELRASSVPVAQASGANWSTEVTNTVTVSATNLDIRDLVNATDSISAYQVSGASWSVVVNEIFGSVGTNVINPDNRIKVELPTGSSGLTDTELRATAVPVSQVSGASWSVEATVSATNLDIRDLDYTTDDVSAYQVSGHSWSTEVKNTVTVTATDLDIRDLANATDSVSAYQVSGHSWSTGVVSITDIFSTTSASSVVNPDNRVKVELPTGSSGLTDTELRASSVPIEQVSGSMWSTAVKEIFGSTITALLNGDNRIPVSVETGGSGLTDSELRATAVPVSQLSGASWSVVVNEVFGSTGTDVINPDGRLKVELPTGSSGLTDTELRASSVPVAQASGALWSTAVKEIFGSTITSDVLNGDNRIRVSVETGGSGLTDSELRATAVPVSQVSGVAWSTYITGSIGTTVVVGNVVSDAADDGSAPVKQGGIARTANPTAVSAGDVVTFGADKLGRQITRTLQVRDLVKTAYATLTNGTETTLLAGVAGSYLDLIYLVGANNSDVAVSVDIRPVTAGNTVLTLQIPASGTAGISSPVPLPQNDTGNNWTADMGDITGTTVSLTALFSQEV